MRIYWIKAQAPRRVLALVKHLGVNAECIELDLMGGDLVRWLDSLARIPAWANPWPTAHASNEGAYQ